MKHTQTTATSFDDFDFDKRILDAIKKIGYTAPTDIQSGIIPHIIAGSDVIAKGQTGSGKTAAFSLPALQRFCADPNTTILILTPTRELAMQVCQKMKQFAENLGVTPSVVYGGEPIPNQLKRLKQDSRIIVGTPGRMLDLLQSKRIPNFAPSIVVLDEADEMLNMGFLEDIETIFTFIPKERQTLLFSATLSPQIKKISEKFLQNPFFLDQTSKEVAHEDIHQIHYIVEEKHRKQALLQLLHYHVPKKSIIFCNTRRQVEELSNELRDLKFSVVTLHGEMTQNDRQISIGIFRKAPEKILVATDVAGRGIDVSDISHVFNYELPFSPDCYTHRIGRTGRMGNKGTAITLLNPRQTNFFRRYLPSSTRDIKFSDLPSPESIKFKQQKIFTDELNQEAVHEDAQTILNSLKGDLGSDDVALRLISRYWRSKASTYAINLAFSVPKEREREKDSRSRSPSRSGGNGGRPPFGAGRAPFSKDRPSFSSGRPASSSSPFKKKSFGDKPRAGDNRFASKFGRGANKEQRPR